MNRARNFSSCGRLVMAMTVALAPLPVLAAEKERSAAEPPPPSGADFARLQREVSEQRQLIIEMMRVEQQRYDMLLRLLQSGGQAPPSAALPPPVAVPPAGGTGTSGTPPSATGGSTAVASSSGSKSGERLGSVSGRVDARNGSLKDAYVYVDLAKGGSGRGHTLEIKQKDKQFWPQTAVVLKGTNVIFPNMDSVFHNVFSTSGRNSFDLGSYRSGDTPRSVVLTTPGVVEVFCNIHSKMNANILVVPGPLYAKVGADGSYRIENVPVGSRKIVAWSPSAKPAQQKIEVSSGGGQANFTLEVEPGKAHTNKLGQPYGSYKD
jgi:plastocyanin